MDLRIANADEAGSPAAAVVSALEHTVLELCERAFWIFDFDSARIVWANRAALATWHAEDLGALSMRDTYPSALTLSRREHLQAELAAGRAVVEQGTFSYLGEPSRWSCFARADSRDHRTHHRARLAHV